MELKNIFRHIKIEKAPEDFTERLMHQIHQEEQSKKSVVKGLLNLRQKILVITSMAAILIFVIINQFVNSNTQAVNDHSYFIDFYGKIALYLKELELNFDFILLSYLIAFLAFCFLVFDLIFRKRFNLSH